MIVESFGLGFCVASLLYTVLALLVAMRSAAAARRRRGDTVRFLPIPRRARTR